MTKHTRRFTAQRTTVALFVIATGATTACGPSDQAGRQPLNAAATTPATTDGASGNAAALPSAAVLALDAGNTAYRSKDFPTALTKYREATTIAPAHAAPWFGVYMVANEMKNLSLADSAMARVKGLSADPAALGAHAEVAASGEKPGGTRGVMGAAPLGTPLPPGHPTTQQLPPGHPAPGKIPATKPLAPTKRGTL